jgi:uncharacterized membrane protein
MFSGKLFYLVLIISLGAVLVFCFLGINRSIWLDEAYSAYVSSKSFSDIISALKTDAGPPFYYILLAAWIRLFGSNEIAIRSLSIVLYLLSFVAIFKLGVKAYESQRAGFIAALLYLLSPITVQQAQTARMYALLGLLTILSITFFLSITERHQDRRAEAAYIVVNLLGMFTHYLFFFILFAQFIAIVLIRRSALKRVLILHGISFIPFAALWLPVLISQLGLGVTAWMAKSTAFGFIHIFLNFYGGKPALVVYFGIIALVLFGSSGNIMEFLKESRAKLFLILFLTSLFVPFFVSFYKPVFGEARYTVIALVPLVILLTGLLHRFSNQLFLSLFFILMLSGVTFAFVKRKLDPQPCSDKLTSQSLLSRANDGDIIIFTGLSGLGVDYYLKRQGSKSFVKLYFPPEIAKHPGWRDVKKTLEDPDLLDRQAEAIVQETEQLMEERERRVYLFYGLDTEVDSFLKSKLDSALKQGEKISIQCDQNRAWPLLYTEIYSYSKF